jgi:hypothetical protein
MLTGASQVSGLRASHAQSLAFAHAARADAEARGRQAAEAAAAHARASAAEAKDWAAALDVARQELANAEPAAKAARAEGARATAAQEAALAAMRDKVTPPSLFMTHFPKLYFSHSTTPF